MRMRLRTRVLGARLVGRTQVLDFEHGSPDLPPASWLSAALGTLAAPAASVHCFDLADTDTPSIVLSWDDGPDPVHTHAVLDELAAAGGRATFFVLAGRAHEHPALMRRMVAEGHEVGLHGLDHRRLSDLPVLQAGRLIREGRQRLEEVVERPVTLFRPPYGAQSLQQAIATRALGLRVVMWSAWARDWYDADAATLVERAVLALHPGAILLLHDSFGDVTVDPDLVVPVVPRGAVARGLLAHLSRSGIRGVPVGDLLGRRRAVTTLWRDWR